MSLKIIEKIEKEKIFKESENILLYYTIENEVDLNPLIKKTKNKNIFLPCVFEKEILIKKFENQASMKKSKFGIYEPQGEFINKNILDLAIIPSVALDKNKNRIGFGKGFYDKFLSDMKITKIAVAFDFQIVEQIKNDPWDIKMDKIITEKNIY